VTLYHYRNTLGGHIDVAYETSRRYTVHHLSHRKFIFYDKIELKIIVTYEV
jgi:hypothetical protein